MYKKIRIVDTRKVVINNSMMDAPCTVTTDEKSMLGLLQMRPPLVGMYIVNSDGREVKLTFDNYNSGLDAIFPPIKRYDTKNEPKVVNEAVVEEKKDEAPAVFIMEEPTAVEFPASDIVAEKESVVEEEPAKVEEDIKPETDTNVDVVASMNAYKNNNKKKYKK